MQFESGCWAEKVAECPWFSSLHKHLISSDKNLSLRLKQLQNVFFTSQKVANYFLPLPFAFCTDPFDKSALLIAPPYLMSWCDEDEWRRPSSFIFTR